VQSIIDVHVIDVIWVEVLETVGHTWLGFDLAESLVTSTPPLTCCEGGNGSAFWEELVVAERRVGSIMTSPFGYQVAPDTSAVLWTTAGYRDYGAYLVACRSNRATDRELKPDVEQPLRRAGLGL
jgi:hypothetical protein